MTGRIQNLVRERGFGFLELEDGRRAFFYRAEVIGAGFDVLKEGDTVSANCVDAARGLIAVRVQQLDTETKLVELKDHFEEANAS